jgi:hypothetical protein
MRLVLQFPLQLRKAAVERFPRRAEVGKPLSCFRMSFAGASTEG